MELAVIGRLWRFFMKRTHDERYRPPQLLRDMVAEGRLGKKAGIGYYDGSVK